MAIAPWMCPIMSKKKYVENPGFFFFFFFFDNLANFIYKYMSNI